MRIHRDSEDLGPSSGHLSQTTESKPFHGSKSVYSSVKWHAPHLGPNSEGDMATIMTATPFSAITWTSICSKFLKN